jgi:hypoxanthine-guanine phosphoribosyltransferase
MTSSEYTHLLVYLESHDLRACVLVEGPTGRGKSAINAVVRCIALQPPNRYVVGWCNVRRVLHSVKL